MKESIKLLCQNQSDLKALVVMIDDVDTAFQRGWKVLETIRKYMGTPELIVILSGDLELYDMVIRLNLIEQASILRYGDNGRIRTKDMKQLNDFGRQYQLKLLPLEYRINLPSSYDNFIARGKGQKVEIKPRTGEEAKSLSEVFATFCEEIYGVKNIYRVKKTDEKSPSDEKGTKIPTGAEQALSVSSPHTKIFPISNRELIRLIDMVLWPCMRIKVLRGEIKTLEEKNEKQEGEVTKQQGEVKSKAEDITEFRRRVVTALVDLYQGPISEGGINVQALRNAFDQPIEKGLFLALSAHWREDNTKDDFKEFYQPRPWGEYHRNNQILLTVQAAMNVAYSHRFTRIFDYWFLLADMMLTCELNTNLRNEELKHYMDHLHYDEDEPPDIYARKVAWEHNHSSQAGQMDNRIGPGYLSILIDPEQGPQSLTNVEEKCKEKDAWRTYPWLKFLYEHKELEKENKKKVPFIAPNYFPTVVDFRSRADEFSNAILDIFSFNVVENRAYHPYVSFYRGLSVLGEIVKSSTEGKAGESSTGDKSGESATKNKDAKSSTRDKSALFERFGFYRQQRSYLSRNWEKADRESSLASIYGSSSSEDSSSPTEDFQNSPFFDCLQTWSEQCSDVEVPPVLVLRAIWRRTHSNLRIQADVLAWSEWSEGWMLRR
ncbi:MAG: hypothetical protein HQK59_14345, partial [Deltaproteobacteria bacterium]|nr:hypothetical protein [Deltaproteobacteria bacterium]